MKTGPKENSSTLQNVLEKLAPLQNVHRKLGPWKIRPNIFWQNFFCKTMFRADCRKPANIIAIDEMTGDQPISITVKLANSNYIGTCLAPIVHADLLLSDITSMPHNPILSRLLTW